jgi:X-X-X-Leu-X-X-Gly heptad repeat protein
VLSISYTLLQRSSGNYRQHKKIAHGVQRLVNGAKRLINGVQRLVFNLRLLVTILETDKRSHKTPTKPTSVGFVCIDAVTSLLTE